MTNYLWLDGETTGLYSDKHDIVQLACIPVLSGVEHSNTFNEFCQPTNYATIQQEALNINGQTVEKLMTYQKPEAMVDSLVNYLKSFGVKFTIAGYNVGFDKDFLAALFKKVGREEEFFHLFSTDIRDTMKRAKKLKAQLGTPNIKLGTLCAHFSIPINAHDALSDIQATIKLDKILSDMLGETETYVAETHKILDVIFPEPAQLHVHSMFSHTDSINSVGEWADWCVANKVPAFSVVDHGNAASLYDITHLKQKVIGIPGTGLIVELNGNRFHMNAWAVSNVGYKNIIKLASVGWTNRFDDSNAEFPLLPFEKVCEHGEGVVFGLPGVNGPITQLLLSRQLTEAENVIRHISHHLDIVLELAAVDVYKYFDSSIGFAGYNIEGGNIQKHINNFYLNISRGLYLKCIPVSDAHFIDPVDKIIQDCVSKNSFKDNRYFFESRHQVKATEMYSILKGHLGDALSYDDFETMINNTYHIMEGAASIKVKHEYHLPQIEIPDSIKAKTDDYNLQTRYYMMMKIKEHGRWNDSLEYKERFRKEVEVIMKNDTLNFLPYFLMYEDICAYVRSSGFMQGIARGSAGGSLLSYYLKIIHVDPVAANLPFERFLSKARIRAGSFPDIDLDIADCARPEVMKYLKDTYGLGFAQIATFNKMKTKNAIKDAMYALYGRNRNDQEVKAICDQIDDSPQGVDEYDFLYGYVDQEGDIHKGEIEKKPMLANFFKQRPEVESMVKKLIGAIRGWSRHASAFVISTLDLSADRVPTMVMTDKDVGDILVTQFDATMVEKSGLVKADILGIKTLSMVSDCLKLVKSNHAVDFNEEEKGVPAIYRLPDRDEGVFTDFYKADTDSTFQFNSDVIKGAAKEFAPLCREDLALMTALYRPGAMDAQSEFVLAGSTSKKLGKDGLAETMAATEVYVNARNGNFEPYYIHDDLRPYVEDTFGVIVFQEQVMAILVGICGYSLEETDIIRSAIAKKKHEVIMATFERIRV
jgi:DNA polymerase-3 subunit alpha